MTLRSKELRRKETIASIIASTAADDAFAGKECSEEQYNLMKGLIFEMAQKSQNSGFTDEEWKSKPGQSTTSQSNNNVLDKGEFYYNMALKQLVSPINNQ